MKQVNCHKCNKIIYIYPYRLKKTKNFSCKECWNRTERKLDNQELKKIYLSGLSCEKIAKQMKVSAETIRRKLIKMKIKRKLLSYYMKGNKHPQYLTNIDDNIIRNLYINNKLSSNEIAKKLDISSETVLRRLEKNDVKIRDSSECSRLSLTPKRIEDLRRRNLIRGIKPPVFKGHTLATRKKMSQRYINLWKDKDYRERTIKAMLKGLSIRPTSLEQQMIDIIKKYNLPYKYVGDGSFLIGYKNPDFVNINGEKKLIEVGNVFHHKLRFGSVKKYTESRKKYFMQFGWKSLILISDDINEKEVIHKLKNFN